MEAVYKKLAILRFHPPRDSHMNKSFFVFSVHAEEILFGVCFASGV